MSGHEGISVVGMEVDIGLPALSSDRELCGKNSPPTSKHIDTRRKTTGLLLITIAAFDLRLDFLVPNPPAMQKMWVPSLGLEDPLVKEMATGSSILALKIPRTEEPGGL